MIRLDKYLAELNTGTRSEIRKEIRRGQAEVNGQTVKDPGFLLNGDERVVFRGSEMFYEEKVWYMMNKPAGVISATTDRDQMTVLDLLKGVTRKNISPVGRLDKDTEGLLLLTNDGELAHRLLSPRHHVEKTYYAKVLGFLTKEDIDAFRSGIRLSSKFTALPAELTILSSADFSEAEVTVMEGKFHQVKRMFHAVGKEVVFLKRISMGPLQLDENLKPGEYRKLSPDEIRQLESIK